MKKRVFVDMDNTLVDFNGGMSKVPQEVVERLPYNYEWDMPAFDGVEGYFASLEPNKGGIETMHALHDSGKYELYILTSSPWEHPNAAMEKLDWIHRHFGKGEESIFYKNVIMSHHKDFIKGDILIDDRMDKNGAGGFDGEKIEYGSEEFPDWESIRKHLLGDGK